VTARSTGCRYRERYDFKAQILPDSIGVMADRGPALRAAGQVLFPYQAEM